LWTSGAFAVAGTALLAARAWILREPAGGAPRGILTGSVLSPEVASERGPRASRVMRALVPSAAVVALVVGLVVHKQHIIDVGTPVLLELAPRDPRSLLQGDYVQLRYGAPAQRIAASSGSWQGGVAVLRVDGNGVGHYERLDDDAPLGEREVRIRYARTRQEVTLGPTSYFFQEGRGATWEQARFAEMRVDADGTAVLVGLRDADLRRIE
jgi:uncharacterized membrane-anchored protein